MCVMLCCAGFPGMQSVRVARDRSSGRGKGYAFVVGSGFLQCCSPVYEGQLCVHESLTCILYPLHCKDFDSVESAMAFMDSDACDSLELGGSPLRWEYSVAPLRSDAAGAAASTLDWLCSMCQAKNFSRWPPLDPAVSGIHVSHMVSPLLYYDHTCVHAV